MFPGMFEDHQGSRCVKRGINKWASNRRRNQRGHRGLCTDFGSYSKFDGKLSGVWGRRVTYLGFNRIELAIILRLDYRGVKSRSRESGWDATEVHQVSEGCLLTGWLPGRWGERFQSSQASRDFPRQFRPSGGGDQDVSSSFPRVTLSTEELISAAEELLSFKTKKVHF